MLTDNICICTYCNQYFSIVSSAFDCANAEPNGFFSDPEQCDLYYECVDGVSTVKLCPDGLMFDDTNKIDAKCDYPFNVDCGKREYVRKLLLQKCSYVNVPYITQSKYTTPSNILFIEEPETGIDERCYRANGFFNHEKEDECNK